jgi:HAD superfamily hydrolase (TIGR01490 family)
VAIAFFDLDGTLLRADSGRICAIPSIREGLVGPRRAAELIATYALFQLGLRTRRQVQLVGFSCYRGRTLDELRAIMTRFHDNHMRAQVSAPMRARVAEHRARGDLTAIITASAFFFAEPLARELGIDEVVGTQVGFADGRCTGLVDGEIVEGEVKLVAARRIAAAAGVALADCSFYSDHIADLPLLEAVGHAVAVGPHSALERVARERGWAIVLHG